MKVVWGNDTETKPRRKRITLYWLYTCEKMKRKYVCSFMRESEALDAARYMSERYDAYYGVAKREERGLARI